MDILNPKYKFEGIGAASATAAMAALSTTSLAPFTAGFAGKITFQLLKLIFMSLASAGLIVLNVGVAKVEVLLEEHDYNSSWEEAEKILKEKKGQELTQNEINSIDDPVKDAFRRFASFGVRDNGGNTGNQATDSSPG